MKRLMSLSLAVVGLSCRQEEEVPDIWTFTGLSLQEDGCEFGVASLLDGKYEMTPRSDGGMTFDYQHGVSTNIAAPQPLSCERAGERVTCWPFDLPNMRPPDYATYPWVITAHLSGDLSEDNTLLDATVTLYGTCPDGGWSCTDGVEDTNPSLPCTSTLTLSGALPVFREPGECPAEGEVSAPGGLPATLTLLNESGKDIEFAWLDEYGQRSTYTSLGEGRGPFTFYTTVGTWWVLNTYWGDDDDCRAGFQIDQAEQYIVVKGL